MNNAHHARCSVQHKETAQIKDNSTIQTAEIFLANVWIPMDQKAKENSGSGPSWHLGRGLAIPSLRLFRGFQGRVVWWIWVLENQFYSYRDYSLLWRFPISLVFCFVLRTMLSIKRFPGSKVQRCGSGEISAGPVFPAYDSGFLFLICQI